MVNVAAVIDVEDMDEAGGRHQCASRSRRCRAGRRDSRPADRTAACRHAADSPRPRHRRTQGPRRRRTRAAARDSPARRAGDGSRTAPRRDAHLPVARRRARSWWMVAMSAPCSPRPSAARLSELRATDRDSLIAGWDALMPKAAPAVRRSGITGPVHRRPLRRHRDARPRHAARIASVQEWTSTRPTRSTRRAPLTGTPASGARPGCSGSASDPPRRRDRRSRPDRPDPPGMRATGRVPLGHAHPRTDRPPGRLRIRHRLPRQHGPLWWHPAGHRLAGQDCGPSWSC
jgi:hypothetical protein